MKKSIKIAALFLCAMMLFSCNGNSSDAESTTTAATDAQEKPLSTTLTMTYTPKSGTPDEVTADGSVELTVSRAYKTGDKITVTLPEGQHYLAFCMAKGVVEETILYLPDCKFTYTAQNMSISYPSEMNQKECTITARIPSEDDLVMIRNLACNPADLMDADTVFPHASTSSVHDITNESNRLQFESRNVIDGFTDNKGHGYYPYQSWGPASSMGSTDKLKISFGREVTLTELVVYLRADFPHDTYWDSCTVKFSDGSSMKLNFDKSSNAQKFALDTPITTSSLLFTNFHKVDGSDWAAWMEVQAIGYDIVT